MSRLTQDVLVEHQSTDDPLMAFRMVRSVNRIWDHYLRDNPKARRLPAVIPLVVCPGRSRWASPVQLAELIDLAPGTRRDVQGWLHFCVVNAGLSHTELAALLQLSRRHPGLSFCSFHARLMVWRCH